MSTANQGDHNQLLEDETNRLLIRSSLRLTPDHSSLSDVEKPPPKYRLVFGTLRFTAHRLLNSAFGAIPMIRFEHEIEMARGATKRFSTKLKEFVKDKWGEPNSDDTVPIIDEIVLPFSAYSKTPSEKLYRIRQLLRTAVLIYNAQRFYVKIMLHKRADIILSNECPDHPLVLIAKQLELEDESTSDYEDIVARIIEIIKNAPTASFL